MSCALVRLNSTPTFRLAERHQLDESGQMLVQSGTMTKVSVQMKKFHLLQYDRFSNEPHCTDAQEAVSDLKVLVIINVFFVVIITTALLTIALFRRSISRRRSTPHRSDVSTGLFPRSDCRPVQLHNGRAPRRYLHCIPIRARYRRVCRKNISTASIRV